MAFQLTCVGGCGKTIINDNENVAEGTTVICPECATATYNKTVESVDAGLFFDPAHAGFAFIAPKVFIPTAAPAVEPVASKEDLPF